MRKVALLLFAGCAGALLEKSYAYVPLIQSTFSSKRASRVHRTKNLSRVPRILLSCSSQSSDVHSIERGQGSRTRPPWAPKWIPSFAFSTSPYVQVSLSLLLYAFHMLVLSKGGLVLPVQVIPNDRGLYQMLDFDNLAGFVVLGMSWSIRRASGFSPLPKIDAIDGLPFAPDPDLRWPTLPLIMGALSVAYVLSG